MKCIFKECDEEGVVQKHDEVVVCFCDNHLEQFSEGKRFIYGDIDIQKAMMVSILEDIKNDTAEDIQKIIKDEDRSTR